MNNSLLGLEEQTFRVTKRAYEHASAAVELHLEQDDPSHYPSVSNAQPQAPGVSPDTSYRVLPPTGLVLTNPAPGVIHLSVDPTTDLKVQQGGALLIQVQSPNSEAWVSLPNAKGDATEQTLNVLQKGLYVVQVDWQSNTGQQSGQWLAGVVHVEQTAFATGDDVSNAVSGYAQKDNPVFTGVMGIPAYTFATLPSAGGDHTDKTILVTDSSEGRALCVSDGTDWISQITALPVEALPLPPSP